MEGNKKILVIVVIAVLVILVGTLFFLNNAKKEETGNIEEELIADMKDYYTKYLDGKVIGITKHKVSLEMLEKTGYDMKNYDNCDLKESYSYIEDKDDKITVENHLSCDK
jgi:hypothetical protein